jgi:hypothetical protein
MGVLLITLPAIVLMVSRAGEPLGGSHVFRQAHVTANIEKFVQQGLSLRPSTYEDNAPFAAFDFPLYQLAVAGACRLAATEPLRTARLASVLLLVVALVVLDRLLVVSGVRRWPRAAALALFAYAPLDLFYFQAPMVDGLAVLLALVSLQQYVAAQQEGGRPRALVVMLLAGFLSTLIKSPVYLPVFLAILWHRLRRDGLRGLARPETVALVAAAGLGVLCFKAYWMVVNGTSEILTPWERQAYFGTLAERLGATAWRPVLSDLLRLTTNPVIAALAVLGALHWARRRGPVAPVFAGLLLGSGVTLLVFFDRYPPHNYYQLPFVFPLAFFGAQGLQSLRVLARAGRRSGRPLLRATRALVPLAILATGAWSWTGFKELAASSQTTQATRSRGEWIHRHTRTGDYVIYILDGPADDWNPTFLYFAHRDGRTLSARETTPARLTALEARARERHGRVLVFTSRGRGQAALVSLGAEPVAAERHRALFRLGNAALDPLVNGTSP